MAWRSRQPQKIAINKPPSGSIIEAVTKSIASNQVWPKMVKCSGLLNEPIVKKLSNHKITHEIKTDFPRVQLRVCSNQQTTGSIKAITELNAAKNNIIKNNAPTNCP